MDDFSEYRNEVESSKTCLYIGNISQKCTKSDLFELFSNFGEISDIQIQRQPQDAVQKLTYGFVRFLSASDALNAKNRVDGGNYFGTVFRFKSFQISSHFQHF